MKESEENELIGEMIRRVETNPSLQISFFQDPISTLKKEKSGISDQDAKAVGDTLKRCIPIIPGFEKEDMKNMIKNLNKKTDEGFKKILHMSQVLFYVGISIIIVTFVLEIYEIVFSGTPEWGKVAAHGIIGGGFGISGILTSFVFEPMKKIRRNMGDTVQLNIAISGYYNQLSILNHPEIKIDYENAAKLAKQIEESMSKVMDLVEKYCEPKSK